MVIRDLGLNTDLEVMDQLLSVNGQFLIDAGCGNMRLSQALAERGASVLAIDPDTAQAELNRAADIIPNVGFAETTADKLPVEAHSIDGVIFSYSLHHVPKSAYSDVVNEVLRVLKPTGFLYAVEPVAAGPLNSIMSLFHDEKKVRADAQLALKDLAIPAFKSVEVVTYHRSVQYHSFAQFADHYATLSYNANYTEQEVRQPGVEDLFEHLGKPVNYRFDAPMHVTHLQGLAAAYSA